MATSYEDDKKLIEQCSLGNREASEIFVQRYSNLIYHSVRHALIVKQISYTRDDLEDIHNTVFLHLFDKKCRKLIQYQGKNGCSLATWIRTVTVRIVLNYIRKRGVDGIREREKSIPLEDIAELREKESEAGALLEQSELEQLLKNEIQKLPPKERLLLKLHFEQDLSLPEVSEIMGITVKNAYTIKHRAVQRLKEVIKRGVED